MDSYENGTVTFRRAAAGVRPRSLAWFARKLQAEVTRGRAFDCLITGDAEMRKLNLKFRKKNSTTDVLSFSRTGGAPSGPVGPGQAGKPVPLGDIAISIARAREQARRYGHSTEDEIRILMLHGALHLAGFDHESDAGRMARAEKRWRARLGLPGGLIERAHA